MKYGYLFLAIPFLIPAVSASAAVSNDSSGVCYKFENDQVVQKDVCLISFVGGQGEGFWNLKVNNETYELYEHDESYKKYGQHYFKLNGQPAESYYRNPNHYAVSYDYDDDYDYLSCYKSESDEICYKTN